MTIETNLNNINFMSQNQYNSLAEKNDNELYAVETDISDSTMPSDNYVNLTLGSSGSNYTAPDNGYFMLRGGSTSGNKYVSLQKDYLSVTGITVSGISDASIIFPCKKGKSVTVSYSADTSLKFRFFYLGEN